jgi:hypothetical protein
VTGTTNPEPGPTDFREPGMDLCLRCERDPCTCRVTRPGRVVAAALFAAATTRPRPR